MDFIKSSIKLGALFGIGMAFIFAAQYNLPISILAGFISGVIFGPLLTLFFILVNYFSNGKVSEAYKVEYSEKIILPCDNETAMQLCEEAVMQIKGCKIKKKDLSRGEIIAKKRFNIKTWGDKILIKAKSMDANSTEIDIVSRPIAKTTIVDYGSNKENVQKIKHFIHDEIKNLKERKGKGVKESKDKRRKGVYHRFCR